MTLRGNAENSPASLRPVFGLDGHGRSIKRLDEGTRTQDFKRWCQRQSGFRPTSAISERVNASAPWVSRTSFQSFRDGRHRSTAHPNVRNSLAALLVASSPALSASNARTIRRKAAERGSHFG